MRPITVHEVTPAITALFDITSPTMPRAFNVLDGIIPGEILVDNQAQPAWAIVRDEIYGTLYPGGEFTPALLARLVDDFRAKGDVGIGCWPDDPINRMLPPNPEYDGIAVYFTNRSAAITRAVMALPLPPGYSLVLRGQGNIAQSLEYESLIAIFGNVANILHRTLGVFLLHGSEVACEASTGVATHGQIEIGVTTAEPYRQRGLATIACARLIALCEQQGDATWWDCAKQNVASVRLARRLGYQNEREYRYVQWAAWP